MLFFFSFLANFLLRFVMFSLRRMLQTFIRGGAQAAITEDPFGVYRLKDLVLEPAVCFV